MQLVWSAGMINTVQQACKAGIPLVWVQRLPLSQGIPSLRPGLVAHHESPSFTLQPTYIWVQGTALGSTLPVITHHQLCNQVGTSAILFEFDGKGRNVSWCLSVSSAHLHFSLRSDFISHLLLQVLQWPSVSALAAALVVVGSFQRLLSLCLYQAIERQAVSLLLSLWQMVS